MKPRKGEIANKIQVWCGIDLIETAYFLKVMDNENKVVGDLIENSRDGIFKLLLDLAAVPSISATSGENEMAGMIYRKLTELPYFEAHPGYLKLLPIKNDPLERQIVFALVKA